MAGYRSTVGLSLWDTRSWTHFPQMDSFPLRNDVSCGALLVLSLSVCCISKNEISRLKFSVVGILLLLLPPGQEAHLHSPGWKACESFLIPQALIPAGHFKTSVLIIDGWKMEWVYLFPLLPPPPFFFLLRLLLWTSWGMLGLVSLLIPLHHMYSMYFS